MAIARITGNILQDNLQRGSNLSVQGNLIYFDVTNDRVGILTDSPDSDFTVIGSANVSANISSGNINNTGTVDSTGNIDGGNLNTTGNVTGGNVVSSADVTTVSVTATGNVNADTFRSTNTTLAPPSPGSYNSERLTLYNFENDSKVNYAIGVEASAIWHSVDTNLEGQGFKWYGNTTQVARISGVGNLTLAGNIVANANITGDNFSTSGEISATANITGGNLITPAQVVATGNITGGKLITAGAIEGANILVNGTEITSDANLTIATSNNGNLDFDINGSGVASFNNSTSLTIPTGNTAQRPGTPATGAFRFNTSTSQAEIYDGAEWGSVSGSEFAEITGQTIIGDDSTTTFTLDRETTEAAIIVSTNGVVQLPGTAYTVTGNQITFAEAPVSSDTIDVRFNSIVSTVGAITNTSGNSSVAVEDNGIANIATVQSLQLPSYTVAQASNLANTADGQVIYVTNGDSGSPCLAVYSVDNWKRVNLGANIASS